MSTEQTYVGIDVSKEQLDVAVQPGEAHWTVGNDPEGIGRLVSELKPLEPALVVLEATGGLELPVAAELATADIPVAVVNLPHTRAMYVTSPRPEAGWPRPTAWMHRSLLISVWRSGLERVLYLMPRHRHWRPSWPDDDRW